jgi:hypothetical protein
MTEATSTRRGGLELLANDLIDPAVVARNLESMRRAEQWMKVRSRTLCSRIPLLTVKFRQPSYQFTFGVAMSFILYPLVLTPLV